MKLKSYFNIDGDSELPPNKLSWWYAPIFVAFWLVLYLSGSTSLVNKLPTPLTLRHEESAPDSFISERAERTLVGLSAIGPRTVGSEANEIKMVEFLQRKIANVKAQISDYFELEVQLQEASGSYIHWSMVNMYQSVQNVVVKLSAKNSSSQNYLLINSHFDTAPGSVGASDDGSMVSVMLEVMRVIARSQGPIQHPIVFLFNGAEENPLQGSHAFITQHEWAKNCKAFINLDAAGNAGREIVFQSDPNHPWLMKYYRNVPYPFANSLAEEMFQNDLIPSDTDFRIFHDFGGMPGIDMAYALNGYVYHTEYDRFNVVARGSLQNSGENVLALIKSIANAPEMSDMSPSNDGHVIFYDFFGCFLIFYTQSTAKIINLTVCAIALVVISMSLFFMTIHSGLNWIAVLRRFGLSFLIHIVSVVLAVGFPVLVAEFMDQAGRPMTWFSESWLVIGLYFCPIFFGLGLLPSLHLQRTKKDALSLGFRIQLVMHANSLFLVLVTIIFTAIGIRSSFLIMMTLLFDIAALVINLLTKWHRKACWFAISVFCCQILPFFYVTYDAHLIFLTMIPMMGRSGSEHNVDLLMALLSSFFGLLLAGFIMPLFMIFHKSRTIIFCFLGITLLSICIAVTPAGFPFREKTAAQRFNFIHARRILHNADNSVRMDESGIYINPRDRRLHTIDEFIKAIGEKRKISDYCANEMFCGMPHFNHRWMKSREQNFWIPLDEVPNIPGEYPLLQQSSLTDLELPNRKRFEFLLSGPDHMTIFIGVMNGARIIDWSFNKTMIEENWEPPYFIYFSYGKDSRSLAFTIEVEKMNTTSFVGPSLEIGIGGHWVHHAKIRTHKYQQFIDSLPEYKSLIDWVATYESWIF